MTKETNKKLSELLGVKGNCLLNGGCNFKNDCDVCMYMIYPNYNNGENFIRLLGCLHKSALMVSFFRSEISTLEFCCEIEDNYIFENRPVFQELFCMQNKDNYQSALVDTLIYIYNREWVSGQSDIHFFREFEETLEELKKQAQKVVWKY